MADTHMMPAESPASSSHSGKSALERKVDAGSWGLFFVWLGLGFLFDIDDAIWLLGVAAIVLGTQALCSRLSLRVEGFWIVVGRSGESADRPRDDVGNRRRFQWREWPQRSNALIN